MLIKNKHVYLLLIIIFLSISDAVACSCVAPEGTIEEQITLAQEQVGIIFTGTVKSIQKIPPQKEETIDPEIEITEFNVKEILKGQISDKVYTEIATVCCMCGYKFEIDKEYLVYGYKKENDKYSTSICTRTSLLEKIQKEELEILRKLKNN